MHGTALAIGEVIGNYFLILHPVPGSNHDYAGGL